MVGLLPVLVANLADERARIYLANVALANQVAVLPLADAPVDATTHLLEVHAPGGEPLLLYADPRGPRTEQGFPLRLRPLDEDHAAVLYASIPTAETWKKQDLEDDEPTLLRQSPDAEPFSSPLSPEHFAALGGTTPERPSSEEKADPLIGSAIGGGKFLIEELLGAGGTGKIYKARHRELRKPIAVKVLHGFYQRDLDFCTRFYGEALAASKLDHPNVLRIVDFGQEPDGMLYIAMEYLEGRDLQHVIDTSGPQPLDRIVKIMMQVCAALTAAHEKGIVHRDVKPENIDLVPGHDDDGNPTEMVKVCDFGIAQLKSSDDLVIPSARDGMIAGTPEYMSPEQCRAEVLDERSDIYACGMMMYELATGRVPFTALTPMAVVAKHIEVEPPAPSAFKSDVDPRLERVILRAIRKDKRERQETARALRAELRQLLESPASPPHPSTPPPSLTRREVRDPSALPSLDDPRARFVEFFVALSTAALRTNDDRGRPRPTLSMARLAEAADPVLKFRGEISFVRRDVGDGEHLLVTTGTGEVYELKRLLPSALSTSWGKSLAALLRRMGITLLTLEDGVEEGELGQLVELLSGPETRAEEVRKRLGHLRMTRAKLLFATDVLARDRKLPWQVELALSRLARDMKNLQTGRPEEFTSLCAQIIMEIVRALPHTEQVVLLLMNADAIADVRIAEQSSLDVVHEIVFALPRARAAHVADAVLSESSRGKNERTHRVLRELSSRFVAERSPDSDELLKTMHKQKLVPLEALPDDLQTWMHAERMAEILVRRPDAILRPLDSQFDAMRFAAELSLLERAAVMLAQRGEARPLSVVLSWIHRLTGSRAEMAESLWRSLEDPALLEPIARTLFSGAGEVQMAAHTVLALMGATGARALYMARAKEVEPDLPARARFAATMRGIGRPAWPVLVTALEHAALPNVAHEPSLAEDLIRALPEVQDEQLGALVVGIMRHGSPTVVRAGVTALATLWGQRARPLLVAMLDNEDDAIRIAALAALRKVGGIDEAVIERCGRMLARGSIELRAIAAAALGDASPRVREAASLVLKQGLIAQKGVLARLRGPTNPVENEPTVVLAIARALVAIGGSDGAHTVRTRAQYTEGPLAKELFELLPR
jgi:serine/threonine-protein kinase